MHLRTAALVWMTLPVAGLVRAGPLTAQELPLRRDLASIEGPSCAAYEAPPEPEPEARTQAAQLAGTADQAIILADLPRALALLDRAVELDGSAELRYRRARVLEDLGEAGEAAAEYCRVLAAAGGEGGFGDARERMERITGGSPGTVPSAALVAARRGVAAADRGAMDDAVDAFDAAVRQAPRWADAVYNLGVALASTGRTPEAVRELRRYLEIAPSAPDAVAVSRRIGQLEVLAREGLPDPRTALTLGMLFPGLGQFYTGRTELGLAVFGLTAGAVAGGLLVTEIHVRCLVPVEPGRGCPAEHVVDRRTERPYLGPALGLAAGVLVFGAVEALVRAQARGGGDAPVAAASSTPRLVGPAVVAHGARVHLRLLGVLFR